MRKTLRKIIFLNISSDQRVVKGLNSGHTRSIFILGICQEARVNSSIFYYTIYLYRAGFLIEVIHRHSIYSFLKYLTHI